MATINGPLSQPEEIKKVSGSGDKIKTLVGDSSDKTLNILSIPSVVSDALNFLKTVGFEETPEMIDLKDKIQKESLDSSNYNLLIDNYTILAQNLANKDKSDLEGQIYSLIMVACVHRCCGNDEKYGNCLNDIFTYADGSKDDELINRLEKIFC